MTTVQMQTEARKIVAPRSMPPLEANLRWACQWLVLLHRDGFPTVKEAERLLARRGSDLVPVARQLLDGTRHLSHPSLDAMRGSLADLEGK